MVASLASLPCIASTPVDGRAGSPSLDEAYETRLLAEVARWDDHDAFEQIYEHHRPAVFRVAYGVCRDTALAEDIVQQTFIAFWTRSERLAKKSLRLRPWLTTVARNAAIDRIRSLQAAARRDAALEETGCAASAEDVVTAGDDRRALMSALDRLAPGQRAAVELIYFAGLTYVAAAEELRMPVGTVKSRVRLALSHLRALLTPAEARHARAGR